MTEQTNGQPGAPQPRRVRPDLDRLPSIGDEPRRQAEHAPRMTQDSFPREARYDDAAPVRPARVRPASSTSRRSVPAPAGVYGGGVIPPQGYTQAPRKGPGKAVAIAIAVLIALLLAVYVGVSLYFSNRFMPNTSVGELDVSLMTSKDAEKALGDAINSYGLTIDGQGFNLALSSTDAGVTIDAPKVVKEMLSDVNPWLWPVGVLGSHDETNRLVATLNGTGLSDAVHTAVANFNATAQQPTNASIAYDDVKGTYSITPEAVGTALDPEKVLELADKAVASLEPAVTLPRETLAQPTLYSNDPTLATAVNTANTMVATNLALSMAGTDAGRLDKTIISKWVYLDDNNAVSLDQDAVSQWVSDLATSLDTVGSQRSYTRADGKAITVAGGTYGWEIDQDTLLSTVTDDINTGTVGQLAIPLSIEGTEYKTGARDWGNRYADVDLTEQHARFYDDSGNVVWETDIITGDPTPGADRATPEGVWYVNNKESPSTLNTYEKGKAEPNKTKVEYWMPFQGNLVGFHDAWWQPGFGGSMYKEGYGSHGCVNLPSDKAQELYGIIKVGDVVVVHW